MKVQVKIPGKLFLAGEYAVVEAGYPAVIAALDQYLTVTIETSDHGLLHSSQQADLYLTWERQEGVVHVQGDHPYALIETAMQVTEEYLTAKGYTCQAAYSLAVQSDLDDQTSGAKYGLGSSGAVTVATVRALLTYYGHRPDALLTYKLAALSQTKLGMTGSFGDLAASSFGGLIAYHSLNRSWLLGKMAELSLLDLVESDWQGLSISPIQLPEGLDLLVGWTGSAASTDRLVSQMESQKSQAEKEQVHSQFLADSKTCVEQLIVACQTGNRTVARQAIAQNRKLLQDFARGMGLVIETPQLSQLCDLAQTYGAVAKSSGAGGGDCGICLVDSTEQKVAIEKAWQQAGILPLQLKITSRE
ncbi:phosphomevalonate kinase [Streptococcus suis]|uniref:phosphomevalonate kinase n=1 Tax=Streptococcus suis TaxID=1307 RepID=UPI000412DA79|nr:phosphomevalonate kinase [Streptococcus suis]HEL1549431.1 phosphomevalonate kinase [Streptococcus suis]HEL2322157.1 phosphomevalonate kinase [Streptococcus suis]HEM3178715.1 phosphomevalonate kinase [Streptococcus suis 92-4172]HEM4926551.1 phosphomevalonate kinase [Streptococcus suis]HEM6505168.1 phosphomevalonate kinase [Streptococcus suis]